MIVKLSKKFHDIITNRAAKDAFVPVSNHVYDKLCDGPEDPWYTKVYYAISRFFRYTLPTPGGIYRQFKWMVQRVRRGWSDRDCWNYSSHLLKTLPGVLRSLKENQYGVPIEFCIDLDVFSPTYGEELDNVDKAGDRWKAVLEKMIVGFEAGHRYEGMDYEAELGEHPFYRPRNVSPESWNVKRDEYSNKQAVLMKRDALLLEEALTLFKAHFWNICD